MRLIHSGRKHDDAHAAFTLASCGIDGIPFPVMQKPLSNRLASAAVISAMLLVAACSTTIVEPFYRPAGAEVEQLYVSPAANFAQYSKLMTNPLEIYYPDNAPEPSAEDLERMRELFRDAFRNEIGDDYQIVAAPGPDVMRIVAQIVDLKILGPSGSYVSSGRLREVVTRGQLTLLIEFRDSLDDRVLLRAGEAEQGDATALTDEEGSWDQVATAARRWSQLVRQFLDRNLATSQTSNSGSSS